jgi:hypothetical protein
MLRDAGELLVPAVTGTVAALTLTDADDAAVKLAQRYAAAIDTAESPGEALERLGPKLLAVLESLGATPAARARLKEGKDAGNGRPSGLHALREAHRA